MDRCEICGARGDFRRIQLREMLFGTRELFTYLRCPGCGVLRIEAVPPDLARHYPPDYYDAPAPDPAPVYGWLASVASRARNESSLFGRSGPAARFLSSRAPGPAPTKDDRLSVRQLGLRSFDDPVLDVGCGRRAPHLVALKRLGFRNLLGIDPFLAADDRVEGISLRRTGIHDVDGAFQTIMFHHSFEHVPDPGDTLRAVEAHLRPGGVVLIRTPVFGTWFWDRFGAAWWELDAPRHLFVHTRASLQRLAEAAGLELVDVRWDSSFLELIASTQIARDIAWREPESWHSRPPAGFDDELVGRFRQQVIALNAAGIAGRAGFTFRRSGDVAVAAADGTQAGRSTLHRLERSAAAIVGRAGFTIRRRDAAVAVRPRSASVSPSPAPAPPADGRVRELIRATARPSATTEPRLNLVIPTLDSAVMFGGVRTAIDLFLALTGSGTRARIISLSPIDPGVAAAFPGFRVVSPDEDVDDARQLVAIAPEAETSLPVGPQDVFVATFWTTADLVIGIRRWQLATFGSAPPRFVYVIQDFEPGFYPWSAQSLLARATYDEPDATIAVFNTSLLRDFLHESGLRFAEEFVFEPRLSPALRSVRERPALGRDQRIVIYGRPRTPRNAFPLIAEGLRAWRAQHPAAAEWSLVSAGQDHPEIDLGGGSRLRSIGKLDVASYGDLLKRSAVGVSLMVSPHPSYPPLEMAHLGMLVLTNRFAGKDLSTWHTNIVSLPGDTPAVIGRELAALCRRFEEDPLTGERGTTLRPDYLGDEPQFPFASELADLIGIARG